MLSKIKGLTEFQNKVTYLSGRKLILLPVFLFLFSSLFIVVLLNLDFNFSSIQIPIYFVIFMEFLAIFLVYLMWRFRDKLKVKYPKTCYARIFPIGFSGVLIKILLALHNIIPLYQIGLKRGSESNLLFFYKSFLDFFELNSNLVLIINIIRYLIAGLFVIIGFMMIFRAIGFFGFDYMAVVYLYFPEESKIQDQEIFSILRHPTYFALICFSFGGFIFQFSIFSLICLVFCVATFLIHIFKVEEKELTTRFGFGFTEYKKKTPAIIIRPRDFSTFLKLLLKKKTEI